MAGGLSQGRTGPRRSTATASRSSTQFPGHLADRIRDLSPPHALVEAVPSASDLDHPLFREHVADGDPDGYAKEVGVFELHPGALVAVVEQDREMRGLQVAIDLLDGLAQGWVPRRDGHQVNLERSDGPRPDDPVRVVVLLDSRRRYRRGADAVAAHHYGLLLPLLVEVHRPKRHGILGPELEDVADLDDLLDAKRPAALGTPLARQDRLEIEELAG